MLKLTGEDDDFASHRGEGRLVDLDLCHCNYLSIGMVFGFGNDSHLRLELPLSREREFT